MVLSTQREVEIQSDRHRGTRKSFWITVLRTIDVACETGLELPIITDYENDNGSKPCETGKTERFFTNRVFLRMILFGNVLDVWIILFESVKRCLNVQQMCDEKQL